MGAAAGGPAGARPRNRAPAAGNPAVRPRRARTRASPCRAYGCRRTGSTSGTARSAAAGQTSPRSAWRRHPERCGSASQGISGTAAGWLPAPHWLPRQAGPGRRTGPWSGTAAAAGAAPPATPGTAGEPVQERGGDRDPRRNGHPEHEPGQRFHEAELSGVAERQRGHAAHAEREHHAPQRRLVSRVQVPHGGGRAPGGSRLPVRGAGIRHRRPFRCPFFTPIAIVPRPAGVDGGGAGIAPGRGIGESRQ